MINPVDLSDKMILITGASSGIGKIVAIQLSKLGAKLVLVARNEDRLKETFSLLEGEGHSIYLYDLNEIDGISNLVDEMVRNIGRFDGLVHCAGIVELRPLKQTNYIALEKTMKINFYCFIELVRCITKKSNYNKGASIVAISSTASKIGDDSKLSYSASKAALDASVRCMAHELSKKGVRVNTVMPAGVDTEMFTSYTSSFSESEHVREKLNRQYLGLVKPIEIANLVAFLESDATEHITGSAVAIDGGYLS